MTTRSGRASRRSAAASTSSASPSRPSSRRAPTSSSSCPASSRPTSSASSRSSAGRRSSSSRSSTTARSTCARSRPARCPRTRASTSCPSRGRRRTRASSTRTCTCARRARDTLQKFFAGLTGDLAMPADHEIGYEETQARTENGEATPDRYWRTYYLHKRAPLTGEYLSNADQTWDQQTGRPEVSFEFDRQGAAISERMTGDNIGRKMAILLDDKINSAPGDRGAHRGARPHHAGRLRRSVRAPAGGQGPGGGASLGRAAGAAAQDVRDAGRPDDGARRGPEGQVLDVHRRGGRRRSSCSSTTGCRGLHRGRRHDPEHALHGGDPGGLRGVADAARDRRPGAHDRHGGRRQHHHLRAHPRGAAPRQVGRARRSTRASQRAFWTVFDAHVTNFVAGRRPLLVRVGADPGLRRHVARRASSPTSSPPTGCRTGCSTPSWGAGAPRAPPCRSEDHDMPSQNHQAEVLRDHQAGLDLRVHRQAEVLDRSVDRPGDADGRSCSRSTPTSSRAAGTC